MDKVLRSALNGRKGACHIDDMLPKEQEPGYFGFGHIGRSFSRHVPVNLHVWLKFASSQGIALHDRDDPRQRLTARWCTRRQGSLIGEKIVQPT